MRSESLLVFDFDIIGIAETHLQGNNIPALRGYTAYTHNIRNVHIRSRAGSGGVCLFMKDDILIFYSVSIVDKSTEDIMWVKLVNKVTLSSTFICVCYLSPERS